MTDFPQRIEAIEKKLEEFEKLLDTTEKEVDSLIQESKLDKTKIKAKEKDLEAWRQKLETCQQEKINMEKELMAQIEELKKSEIPIAEKQKQTNGLLNGQKQALDNLEKKLYEERAHYRKIRDKLISRLLEPCQICEEKERTVKILEDRVQKISIWALLLLLSAVFHFFLFLYVVFKKVREKKPKNSQKK